MSAPKYDAYLCVGLEAQPFRGDVGIGQLSLAITPEDAWEFIKLLMPIADMPEGHGLHSLDIDLTERGAHITCLSHGSEFREWTKALSLAANGEQEGDDDEVS